MSFQLRAVVTDYDTPLRSHLDPAASPTTGKYLKHAPVIRIFGPCENGEKACVQVHGVFPHFYVRCKANDVDKFADEFAHALEQHLVDAHPGSDSSFCRVYEVKPVKAKWFYGSSVHAEEWFLKVSLAKPQLISQAADLIRDGVVLDQVFDICETHIPYLLQFFADYNIYGMGMVAFDSISYIRRGSLPPSVVQQRPGIAVIRPISSCAIECDAYAACITNKADLASLERSLETALPNDTFVPSLLSIRRDLFDAQSQTQASAVPIPSEQTWEDRYWMDKLERYVAIESEIDSTSQLVEMVPMSPPDEPFTLPTPPELSDIMSWMEDVPVSAVDPSQQEEDECSDDDAVNEWTEIASGEYIKKTPDLPSTMERRHELLRRRQEALKRRRIVVETEVEPVTQDDSNRYSIVFENTPAVYTSVHTPPHPCRINHDRVEAIHTSPFADVFYSRRQDVPSNSVTHFAGRSVTVPFIRDPTGLMPFKPPLPTGYEHWYADRPVSDASRVLRGLLASRTVDPSMRVWTPCRLPPYPPSTTDIIKAKQRAPVSQINMATPSNTAKAMGLLVSPGRVAHDQVATQHITCLFIEVHVKCRGSFLPDVDQDAVICIGYCVRHDDDKAIESGAIEMEDPSHTDVEHQRESALLLAFAKLVQRVDPDVLLSFDTVESLGYILERGDKLGIDLLEMIQRALPMKRESLSIVGRIVINVWRVLRYEASSLRDSSFHSAVFHILQRRFPQYSMQDLTAWHCSESPLLRSRAVRHCVTRTVLCADIVDGLDVINKTSELARVFGIDFYSCMSRGSQYRVESMLIRIAKTQNYVLYSPSRKQVAAQKAPEAVPLVMEPKTGFYSDPVAVLDFQSLYPSVIIAHNICYSTALGSVNGRPGDEQTFGCTTIGQKPGIIGGLYKSGDVSLAPNGLMFLSKRVKCGVLPRLLQEILETRIAIKKSMAQIKSKQGYRSLYHQLDARQLGLKMIANVTYGYTSAGFSGRMPCVHIADSIVAYGRQALERAIRAIEGNEKWNASIIYGDTDSVFVLLPGRTKDEAFKVAREIASSITASFPAPMELKFEKMYMGSMLSTKKRYVGLKYEHESQGEPVFDAKGIETIRRDQCMATAKIVEKTLLLLFNTCDASVVRQYLESQLTKIMQGRASIHDFIFAKEVRLGTYSNRAPPPPAAIVATKKMINDPKAAPRHGQRVPYVVVAGEPGARLVDLVVSPEELTSNPTLRLHTSYYITKQILPALDRLLSPVGLDVFHWYTLMPKSTTPIRNRHTMPRATSATTTTLDQYYTSGQCEVCGEMSTDELCAKCTATPRASMLALITRKQVAESQLWAIENVCVTCQGGIIGGGSVRPIECISVYCPLYYERKKFENRLKW